MVNTKKLDMPTLKNVYVDGLMLKEIREQDPHFNLSAEVQALIKDKHTSLKKEEGPCLNPLNLSVLETESHEVKKERQLTLFEDYGTISKFIHRIDDMNELNRLEKTGKVLQSVAHTRKMNLIKSGQIPAQRFL